MKLISILIQFTILFIVTGCAAPVFKTSDIADISIDHDRNANGVKICISSLEFQNSKNSENIVGQAKVGFFNARKDIISDTSLNFLLTDFFTKAFSSAGFIVTTSYQSDFNLNVAFEKLWVEEYANGFTYGYSKSHIKLDIILNNKAGKAIWANSVDKFKTTPQNSMDATKLDIPVLKSNLKSVIQTVLDDNSFWNALNNNQ